jgi:hypothetical protein
MQPGAALAYCSSVLLGAGTVLLGPAVLLCTAAPGRKAQLAVGLAGAAAHRELYLLSSPLLLPLLPLLLLLLLQAYIMSSLFFLTTSAYQLALILGMRSSVCAAGRGTQQQ